MTKTDIYVCCKPLQYFNARNIPQTFHPEHRRILIIKTRFNKADEFYEMVKANDDQWDEVIKVPNSTSLYRIFLFRRFNSLIYGYDTSSILGLLHLIKRFDFYLLEEGISTYLPIGGFGGKKNLIQSLIDRITGVSNAGGYTRFVKSAFVYYPELYIKIRNPKFAPSTFAKPFIKKVSEDMHLFLSVSNVIDNETLAISNSQVLLYITNWNINQCIIEKMVQVADNYDYCIIKPHPHITDYSSLNKTDFVVFNSNLMVEFLLCLWLKQGNKITIYHEGSTSIFYYRDLVEAIDLSPNKNKPYNKLIRGEF